MLTSWGGSWIGDLITPTDAMRAWGLGARTARVACVDDTAMVTRTDLPGRCLYVGKLHPSLARRPRAERRLHWLGDYLRKSRADDPDTR